MVTFETALSIVRSLSQGVQTVSISLYEAQNRILASDIYADRDIPSHNLSAMDGYACRTDDQDQELLCIETIYAGQIPKQPLKSGQCARIMTGAPVPEGADKVVMFEHTQQGENNRIRIIHKNDKINIRMQGEDAKKNQVLLEKGHRINPASIAALAYVGADSIVVSKKPIVGIISTGDELVEINQSAGPAHIRNSNAVQIYSQCLTTNAAPRYYGIAPDKEHELEAYISKAYRECNCIILTGGVSAGDLDLVPSILKNMGFVLEFEKIAIKPGRPTVFGKKNTTFVFGLPGNPVSSMVVFELLVKPFLYLLQGHSYEPLCIPYPLTHDITRNSDTVDEFWPVQINKKYTDILLPYHGSGHFHSYAHADGILHFPRGTSCLKRGTCSTIYIWKS